jgi:hypothetical protein
MKREQRDPTKRATFSAKCNDSYKLIKLELIAYFISKMVKLSTILNAFSIAAVATHSLVLADEGKHFTF